MEEAEAAIAVTMPPTTGSSDVLATGGGAGGPLRQRPSLLSEPGAPASPSPSAPVPSESSALAPDATAAASSHRLRCPLLHRWGAVL